MEADWDEVKLHLQPDARAARFRRRETASMGFTAVTDCRIASHCSAAATWTASPGHAHLDLRIRHDPGAAMDGQQPSEYVHPAVTACLTAYAPLGTRDFAVRPTA
jgi:hypothetical protein